MTLWLKIWNSVKRYANYYIIWYVFPIKSPWKMGVCVWSYFHFFHANLVHRNIGWVPYFSFTEKIWRMSDLELWNVSFFLENVESKKGFKQEENKLGVSSVCLSLCLPNHIQTSSNYDYWTWWLLGVLSKKKHSTFKDIVQIGGREVNPISKK